jgi:hypothetical protein
LEQDDEGHDFCHEERTESEETDDED